MCYVSLQSQRAVKARLVTLGKLFFFLGSIIGIYNKYNKSLSLKCYLYFLTDSEKNKLYANVSLLMSETFGQEKVELHVR